MKNSAYHVRIAVVTRPSNTFESDDGEFLASDAGSGDPNGAAALKYAANNINCKDPHIESVLENRTRKSVFKNTYRDGSNIITPISNFIVD